MFITNNIVWLTRISWVSLGQVHTWMLLDGNQLFARATPPSIQIQGQKSELRLRGDAKIPLTLASWDQYTETAKYSLLMSLSWCIFNWMWPQFRPTFIGKDACTHRQKALRSNSSLFCTGSAPVRSNHIQTILISLLKSECIYFRPAHLYRNMEVCNWSPFLLFRDPVQLCARTQWLQSEHVNRQQNRDDDRIMAFLLHFDSPQIVWTIWNVVRKE